MPEYAIFQEGLPIAPWWVVIGVIIGHLAPMLYFFIELWALQFLSMPAQHVPEHHLIAVYSFETAVKPVDAAFGIAKEQSAYVFTGQSPERNERLLNQNAVKVVGVEATNVHYTTGLPVYCTDAKKLDRMYRGWPCKRGQFTLAFPEANFDDDIIQLLNAVIGEPHHSAWVSRLKLLSLEASPEYLERSFTGPQFGVEGIRQMLNVPKRPLFCGPVKPSVGCTPEEFAQQAYQAWIGGADMVKDDELISNPAYCPMEQRYPLAVAARDRAQEQTGERKMFIAHISGQHIEQYAELAVRQGVDGLMVCPFLVGWQWITKLTDFGVPVFVHNAGMTTTSRSPDFGVHFPVWSKISRWLGGDVIIMPSPAGSFVMNPYDCEEATKYCLEPTVFRSSFPAYAGSKTAAHLPMFMNLVQSPDFIFIVGAALYEHPMGVTAGARALRQGWEAVEQGVDLRQYAKEHPELQTALAQVGNHIWEMYPYVA